MFKLEFFAYMKISGIFIMILSVTSILAQDAQLTGIGNKKHINISENKLVESFKLWHNDSLPKSTNMPLLENVNSYVVKKYEYLNDNYRFLHGVALAWHKRKLYCSFGHNKEGENTVEEEAHGRISYDGGKTWGEMFTIDSGENNLAVSHGVFLSHNGKLWAFQGAYYNDFQLTHTRAYLLNEETGTWTPKGIIIGNGFWPLQEPQKMDNGNWIIGGIRVANGYDFTGNLPSVAISHGDDLTKWDLKVISTQENVSGIWGESTVFFKGSNVINVSRWGEKAKALVAFSNDYGCTWTLSKQSNLSMATSKPYAGFLSTGQYYLIGTNTADTGTKRAPLTIAISRPGELSFSKVFIIREAECPKGPCESNPRASLSYPYAIEYEGMLYVGYSNDGGGIGRIGEGRELLNNNSAELSIIPIKNLQIE